jgi:hypothetical protein
MAPSAPARGRAEVADACAPRAAPGARRRPEARRRPRPPAAAAQPPPPPAAGASRRALLAAGPAALLLGAWQEVVASAADDPESASTAAAPLEVYAGAGYALRRPAAWERADKPGAEALFRDPGAHVDNVGVTVLPVRVASLAEFGSLADAGRRLLAAERAKDGYLSAEMLSQAERAAPGGVRIYDFEYELSTTRIRKVVLASVAIAGGRLFILNGQAGCGGGAGAGAGAPAVALLRRVAASFDVTG